MDATYILHSRAWIGETACGSIYHRVRLFIDNDQVADLVEFTLLSDTLAVLWGVLVSNRISYRGCNFALWYLGKSTAHGYSLPPNVRMSGTADTVVYSLTVSIDPAVQSP